MKTKSLASLCAPAVFGALAILYTSSASATTWYVLPDSTGDAPTIQAAIDSATAGDSILVAAGHYFVILDAVFKDDIVLVSESGPAVTILDALPSMNPQSRQVLRISFSDGFTVEGFTMQNAKPIVVPNNEGGGIRITRSRAFVRNNIIRANQIMNGGAISFDLNCTGCAGSIVEGNTFENNLGGHTAGIYSVDGDGPITIRDNVFTGQTSQHTIYFSGTTLALENNTFDGNSSSVACVSITSASTATGNLIVSDIADGIVTDGATLTNNTVAGCVTGIRVTNGSASNNIAYTNETGIVCDNATLQCNDAFGNSTADYDTTLCPGLTTSNIALDPLFCGALTGDFSLASESPCAPAQAGACGLIGARPVSCTATGVAAGQSKPATWSEVKSLFR